MGLKGFFSYLRIFYDFEIKSDQNGIESDCSVYFISADVSDKIRPKWDWKPEHYPKWNTVIYKIKSDQNGIESSYHVAVSCSNHCLIKSDQNGIESRTFPLKPPLKKTTW